MNPLMWIWKFIPQKLKDNFVIGLVIIALVVGYTLAVYFLGKSKANEKCTGTVVTTITKDDTAHAKLKLKTGLSTTPDLDKRLDRWVRPD